MDMSYAHKRVQADQFIVDDLDVDRLVTEIIENFGNKQLAFGIHITTLNALHREDITLRDLDSLNYIYCDGWSMHLLGRLGGTKYSTRIATTDIYPIILQKISGNLRIQFLGGEEKLESDLLDYWKQYRPGDFLNYVDGFQQDWPNVLREIKEWKPDVLFLGLGMPLELKFVNKFFHNLPECLILNCGGLLRILAGHESRAPLILQKLRVEWAYRLFTSPRRTLHRYSYGLFYFTKSSFRILCQRLTRK